MLYLIYVVRGYTQATGQTFYSCALLLEGLQERAMALLQHVCLAVLPREIKTQEEESANPNAELKRWGEKLEAFPLFHLSQRQTLQL